MVCVCVCVYHFLGIQHLHKCAKPFKWIRMKNAARYERRNSILYLWFYQEHFSHKSVCGYHLSFSECSTGFATIRLLSLRCCEIYHSKSIQLNIVVCACSSSFFVVVKFQVFSIKLLSYSHYRSPVWFSRRLPFWLSHFVFSDYNSCLINLHIRCQIFGRHKPFYKNLPTKRLIGLADGGATFVYIHFSNSRYANYEIPNEKHFIHLCASEMR